MAAHIAPGTVIGGKYRVDNPVTQLGNATLYDGANTTSGSKVLLKVMLPMLAKDREDRGRFEREFQVMAQLRHATVASVDEMGQSSDGIPFMAMEHLVGETLGKRLERGPLSPKEALSITVQLLDAMRLSHGQQVVHRDLQPGNLFILPSPQGTPQLKIISFGSARPIGSAAPGAGQALTAYGTTLGSPEYMAPEQAKGSAVDGRVDIYSIGCLSYAMLAGQPPFPGKQTAQVIMRHMKEDPKSLVTVRPGIPPWFDMWVLRCLRKDPKERFQTPGEAREILENAMRTGFVPPPSFGAPHEAPSALPAAPAAPPMVAARPTGPLPAARPTGPLPPARPTTGSGAAMGGAARQTGPQPALRGGAAGPSPVPGQKTPVPVPVPHQPSGKTPAPLAVPRSGDKTPVPVMVPRSGDKTPTPVTLPSRQQSQRLAEDVVARERGGNSKLPLIVGILVMLLIGGIIAVKFVL